MTTKDTPSIAANLTLAETDLPKKILMLRSKLLGAAMVDRSWLVAVDALEFAIAAHKGQFRKGGETPVPYVSHPITATLYVMTLPQLIYPANTVAGTLLHDVCEDCHISHQDLTANFNLEVADGVGYMTKGFEGIKKTPEEQFRDMLKSPISTIAKPADRGHNQGTMDGAHSKEKQHIQLDETLKYIIPMVKLARRKYTRQEQAYENIKLMLGMQVSLIRARLNDK